ncbi:MAG: HAD family hydrolase [Lachnospiraceae bacterium]|nr:HAD family hydrolase [Lachnospiraceae bacterium]
MSTGIFFDLDGTLWDSAENVVKSWNATFESCGYDLRLTVADLQSVMGKLMEEIADILFVGIPSEDKYDVLKKCEINENALLEKEGGILFDNVEKVISELSKKYKLFIVSNCQAGYIEAFLKFYNFEKYFTDSENPGVSGQPKAENIVLVANRNDIDNIIYVGDTNGDYLSTVKAGGTFIHAAYGFGEIEDETYKINDISELPALLQEIDR